MAEAIQPIATFANGFLTPYTASTMKCLLVTSLFLAIPGPSLLSVALSLLYVPVVVITYRNITKGQQVPGVKVFPDRIEVFRGFPLAPRIIPLGNVCAIDNKSNIQKYLLVTSDGRRHAIHRRWFAFDDRPRFVAAVEGLIQSNQRSGEGG